MDEVRPQPSRDSGSLRAEGILNVLVEDGFSVTFASTLSGFQYTEPLYAAQMRSAMPPEAVCVCPASTFSQGSLRHEDI